MDAENLDQPPFGVDDEPLGNQELEPPRSVWKLLIFGGAQPLHEVTASALQGFRFQDRPLRFLHVYSTPEAEERLRAEPDLAVILLDLINETEDSGLRLVRTIRDQFHNHKLRIVLRTDQAPEPEIVERYDINDCIETGDLTAQRVTTSMFASLRSYRDLLIIDQQRLGLERVIESTASIFQDREMGDFLSGLLLQLVALLNQDAEAFYAAVGFVSDDCPPGGERSIVISGTGHFEQSCGRAPEESLGAVIIERLRRSRQQRRTLFMEDACVFYFENTCGRIGQVYLSGCQRLDESQRKLVELFGASTAIAFENISLIQEVEETQYEILGMLGTLAEFRSPGTGNHVDRVGEYSERLALLYGLDRTEAKLIRLAAPLHDIGNIGIPETVLQKPGPFNHQDTEAMREHPVLGYRMLKDSKRAILSSAAVIARDHQEKWDGSGYPERRVGEDIHLYGRIVAVADVFDALLSTRCYKTAWEISEVVNYFRQQRGRHFDPKLTDLLLENLDQFTAIRDRQRRTGQGG